MTSLKNPISKELLSELQADLGSRRIEVGMQRLASCSHIFGSFDPSMENATQFLGIVAQWCDLGFGDVGLVKQLLKNYPLESRFALPITDYVQVSMAKGMVAMAEEVFDEAISHFDIVLKLAPESESWNAVSTVSCWMARCLKEKGLYENALSLIRRAEEVQRECGHVRNDGPARVLEGFVLFAKGESKSAIKNLQGAQDLLNGTDDYESLGHIQALHGRIMHQNLRDDLAIQYYQKAIELFQKSKARPDNIARTIVDMACSNFNIMRRLRRSIDEGSQQQESKLQGTSRAVLLQELSDLCGQTLAGLDRAAQIYRDASDTRGVSRVHVIRGFLYLESGELDLAANEAENGYQLARSKNDQLRMATARNLQCLVENTAVEEGIGGVAEHALAALEYAREAVELAGNTPHRMVLASAYIYLGLILSNEYFNNREGAHDVMERVAPCLESDLLYFVRESYQRLKKRLREEVTLESALIRLAQGEIGAKTYRELMEDFTDLVISTVWDEEKRVIKYTAARLSISRKKVRRVLRKLDLVETKRRTRREGPRLPATDPHGRGIPAGKNRGRHADGRGLKIRRSPN